MLKVLFLGTGEIGVPSLQALAASTDIEVCGVVTQPDRPAGRHLKVQPSPVKSAALELGLKVYQPEKLRAPDSVAMLSGLEADLFVVVAYGQILSKATLEIPRLGCVNVHASLLPKHRGASPIHAAILDGDQESGVTIMQMDEGLDTGDILHQSTCAIFPDDTAGVLHDRLAQLAPGPLLNVIRQLADKSASRTPQDESLATYAPKISRSHGCLDWSLSAEELERKVRAFNPWPGTFTRLADGATLKIHAACVTGGSGPPGTVLESAHYPLTVATGSGALALLSVQMAGGRRLDPASFLRGHAFPTGSRFSVPDGC